MRCVGLLLAAGFGRRFGADKRLQPLANGTPLGVQTVQNWLAAAPGVIDELYVVTRPNDNFAALLRGALEQASSNSCKIIDTLNADLGMGYSLNNAVAQIPAQPRYCLLVGLADMPAIQPATLIAMAQATKSQALSRPDCVAVPSYDGKPGNPVGFGPAHRGALLACRGDSGARNIVQAARVSGALHYVSTNDPGVHQDVDTAAELAQLK